MRLCSIVNCRRTEKTHQFMLGKCFRNFACPFTNLKTHFFQSIHQKPFQAGMANPKLASFAESELGFDSSKLSARWFICRAHFVWIFMDMWISPFLISIFKKVFYSMKEKNGKLCEGKVGILKYPSACYRTDTFLPRDFCKLGNWMLHMLDSIFVSRWFQLLQSSVFNSVHLPAFSNNILEYYLDSILESCDFVFIIVIKYW